MFIQLGYHERVHADGWGKNTHFAIIHFIAPLNPRYLSAAKGPSVHKILPQ